MGLISEIKRRNVFRMAALYVVAAWLIIQVASELIDLAHLPDWVGPTVLALLVIGFPVALVLSWFYEITPQGISLDDDGQGADDSSTTFGGRRVDFVVIALLTAALLMFAYDKWWGRELSVGSLAVLPVVSLSTNQEIGYLADALTEGLIGELGRIDGLSVISRTSSNRYRTTDLRVPDIASELRVDALIEGSVQAFEDALKIELRLVDGRSDRQVWSGSYESGWGGVRKLQGRIAREVAERIRINLSPETEAELSRHKEMSPDAFRFWVLGNHDLLEIDDASFSKALMAFRSAIEIEPEFAEAYAGIAQVHAYQAAWFGSESAAAALPLAREAADQALRLDPDLAVAHYTLGIVRYYSWDWEGAEGAFRTGLRLSRSVSGFPGGSTGEVEFASFLTAMGRSDEAIEIAEKAVELDPLSPVPLNEMGWALQFDGQNDAALETYRRALELDRDFSQTNALLAIYHIVSGQPEKAMPYLEKINELAKSQSPTVRAHVGMMLGLVGRERDARRILDDLSARAESEHIPAVAFAYLYLGLGENERALEWLEAAYAEHDVSLVWLKEMPLYDALREHPRFKELVARMGFPD
jgi:TolB-like protein/lipoprotein NlpI